MKRYVREDEKIKYSLSNKERRSIDRMITRIFVAHYCPMCSRHKHKRHAQLVYLEDDACPECGFDLRNWRIKWAKGFRDKMSV